MKMAVTPSAKKRLAGNAKENQASAISHVEMKSSMKVNSVMMAILSKATDAQIVLLTKAMSVRKNLLSVKLFEVMDLSGILNSVMMGIRKMEMGVVLFAQKRWVILVLLRNHQFVVLKVKKWAMEYFTRSHLVLEH